MNDNSHGGRPSIPDTWGSENVSPTRSYELIIQIQSNISNLTTQESKSEFLTDLTPTEEYLQMMKRVIESNSLSPRTTVILQELYDRYKSIKGYGPATWDTQCQNIRISVDSEASTEDESLLQTLSGSRRNTTGDLEYFRYSQEQRPSSSKACDTSLIDSKESLKSDQRQKYSVMERTSRKEIEERQISAKSFSDLSLTRPCNSEIFKIDDVFSNFSFRESGNEKILRKHIGLWMARMRARSRTSGNTPRGSSQNIGNEDTAM
ncbi:uncharacterized protein LOC143188814 [Calliopsis andreniformis]|uniref:uncharacterized protein LOC143188814 n=1 Tax=Calliopsis andreniformis TaxID=337506 RepID=UPI003FCC5D68